jgi:hypothetical protein
MLASNSILHMSLDALTYPPYPPFLELYMKLGGMQGAILQKRGLVYVESGI